MDRNKEGERSKPHLSKRVTMVDAIFDEVISCFSMASKTTPALK